MQQLTPKQLAFAQRYIELGNASEAYRQTYHCERMQPATIHNLASRLLQHPKVAAHIQGLQAAHQARHRMSVDDLLEELEQARQAALKASTPQSSAAVSATMGKAKLLGLDKQVMELTGKDGKALVPVGLGYFYAERGYAESTGMFPTVQPASNSQIAPEAILDIATGESGHDPAE